MFCTVVINCFNGEEFLNQTLESLKEQTDQDFQILFWDNASTDKTPEIASSWQQIFGTHRFQYFKNNLKTGLAEARNQAVQHVHSEWFAFLDADDLWKPNKLKVQKKLLLDSIKNNDHCSIGLVYNRANYFTEIGKDFPMQKKFVAKQLPHGNIFYDLLFEENFISLTSAIMKTSLFKEFGGIPHKYKQAEDYYIFCKFAENSHVLCCQEVLSLYRVHPNQLTSLQRALAYDESIEIVRFFCAKHNEIMNDFQYFSRYRKRISELNTQASIANIRYEKRFFFGLKRLIVLGNYRYLFKLFVQFLKRN